MTITPLLISNVSILTDASSSVTHHQWLLCKGDRIHSFGDMDSPPHCPEASLTDGEGKLLMPGLINGHNHSAMSLFRGLADDLELGTWLNDHIFPAEATHVNEEMVYWCTKLSCAEMLLSGTTTVADGYFHEDQAARAFLDSGMRAVAAQGIVDFPAPGVANPDHNINAVQDFIQQWQDVHSRITPAVFAHAPYTCSPQTLQKAKALATKHGVPFFIHIAESRHEQEIIIDPQGTSPIRHLAALGLLDRDTVLIHCVWLDAEDMDLIHESGAGVVVCPQSQAKLASGIAQATEMDKIGIPVGIGSDGSASNNGLDIFREMDFLAKSQKVRSLDATVMPAMTALAAATSNNASILGLDGLGKIEAGYRADLILVDINQAHLQPFYGGNTLIYSGSGADVQSVIVDGRLLVKNGKLLSFDLQECMEQVQRLAVPLGAI
jgi:5-methylthioadenosine/S-adenosylhomocysteine deaminase